MGKKAAVVKLGLGALSLSLFLSLQFICSVGELVEGKE